MNGSTFIFTDTGGLFLLSLSFRKSKLKFDLKICFRLLPPYVIIMVINIFIIPSVGNGPIWDVNNSPGRYQECKDYFWSKVLLLNNFIGTDVRN